uniref:C2H2-type domain-containing protein n=1 Tax=Timema tahoe TaxID=61484 RepID=A0A7R9NUC7_9NEOP|nr:unnamed protein product [Timema tahoe]
MSEATHPVLITFSGIREYIKEEPDFSPSCRDADQTIEGQAVFKSHLGEMGQDSTKLITCGNFNKKLRFEECNFKQMNEDSLDDDDDDDVEEEAVEEADYRDVEEDVDSDGKRKDMDSYYTTRSNPKQTHEPSSKLKKDQVDLKVQEVRMCDSCSRVSAPQDDICDPVETGRHKFQEVRMWSSCSASQGDICDPVETGRHKFQEVRMWSSCSASQGDICDPVETGRHKFQVVRMCGSYSRGSAPQGDICDPVKMGRHKCSVCDKQFSIKKHLINHYPAHIEPEYRCVVCSKWFSDRKMLVSHYNTHIKPPGFDCTDCGLSFATKAELLGHFPLAKEKVQFKCLECGIFFWNKRFLLCHYSTHIKLDKGRCKCGKCKKCLRRAKRSSEHLGTRQETEYRCEECDTRFATKFMLLNHRQKRHQRNTCKLCGRRFNKRASLLKHKLIHYKKKMECEECELSPARLPRSDSKSSEPESRGPGGFKKTDKSQGIAFFK